jgi:alpha-beta hydrolase superfamily lysophospholipase
MRPRRALAGTYRAALAALLFACATVSPAGAATTVTFAAEDGVQLTATVWEPAGRATAGVVLVHMLTRTRQDWDRVGEGFAQRGIVAVALDLRGHGDSQGAYSSEDQAPLARDVAAAIRYLQSRHDPQVTSIGVAGVSAGATLAVMAAASSPSVKSMALISPGLEYRGLRLEEPLKRVAERPALLVASSEDAYAARTVRALAGTGPGARELQLLDGAGHGMRIFRSRPDLIQVLVDWFSRTLL